MSNQTLNRELLEKIRALARTRSLEDKSKTHQQWLRHFSEEYGHSWESLNARVDFLEKVAYEEKLAAAEAAWVARLAEKVWGEVPHTDVQTMPLPVDDDNGPIVPWPNCFIGSHIFSPNTEEPHELVSGSVFNMDKDLIEFDGEQLWFAPDKFVFMTLMIMSRELPTGAILDFTWQDIERVTGQPLNALGAPITQDSFIRSLWRLVHGVLSFERYNFKGPLLKFSDISNSPERFSVAFNPDFSNFYYPSRKKLEKIKIKTQDEQRLLWSEKLITYLACRAKRWTPFLIGEWLETLVTNELNALLNCVNNHHEGKSTSAEFQDLIYLALTAYSVETGQNEVTVAVERFDELHNSFLTATGLEELRRNGLIELPHGIGISHEKVIFQITEQGIAVGLNGRCP